MKAWHFLNEDQKLQFLPHTKVTVGEKLVFDGEPIMCRQGFHASSRIIDALGYAPGPVVCRVELSGQIIKGDDKCVATERTVLQMADISTLLHEFACDEAERALKERKKAGDEPDKRSWAAIDAKRKWLRGEITDDGLDAAREAAWDAARDAARDAAWAAAWEAAWGAQNRRLTRRVNKYLKEIA